MKNLFKVSLEELGLYIGNRIMKESEKWASTNIKDYHEEISFQEGENVEIDEKELIKFNIENRDKNNIIYKIDFYEETILLENGTIDTIYYIDNCYKNYLENNYEEKFLKKTETENEISDIEKLYFSTYGKLIQLIDKLKEKDIEKSKKIQKILDNLIETRIEGKIYEN